jgi:hypothetical protein
VTQSPRKSQVPWKTLLTLAAVGIAAVLFKESERYSIIPRVADGVVVTEPLRRAISDAHAGGRKNFACTAHSCPLMDRPLELMRSVTAVQSDHTGRITVEYKDPSLQAHESRLVLSPLIDGREVDLSKEAADGRPVTWRCGGTAETTVPKKYLPRVCQ